MTNRAKAKGDRAELEVQGWFRDHLGLPARRALGAGRADDVGDIHGLPDTVIGVANYADLDRAVRDKLPDLEWTAHLMGKNWLLATNWSSLLRSIA